MHFDDESMVFDSKFALHLPKHRFQLPSISIFMKFGLNSAYLSRVASLSGTTSFASRFFRTIHCSPADAVVSPAVEPRAESTKSILSQLFRSAFSFAICYSSEGSNATTRPDGPTIRAYSKVSLH